jgi:hypothetical protein
MQARKGVKDEDKKKLISLEFQRDLPLAALKEATIASDHTR